jgi:hypothetical protein
MRDGAGYCCPLGEAAAKNRNCRSTTVVVFPASISQEEFAMRIAALALLGSLGLAVSAVSANAAPAVPSLDTQQASNIVEVAGGCGRWAHPNRWGRCVPNGYGRWSQSRDYYYGGGYRGDGYYGGGYPHRHYRSWYGY